ncbi:hypothetical protein OHB06_15705 [Streptomyces sp. NBC_01604]|uniref:hypothetical protein n=1 Tax=Streptomyces sp. NBC_01604 TaxID=2975894 RepID=UPI0038657D5A
MSSDETTSPDMHEQRRSHFDLAHSWANTVAGVAALFLAAFNFFTIHREPDVDVSLPHIVRLGQGSEEVWVYLQPTVSTKRNTEKVELVNAVKLDIRHSDKNVSRPTFFWDESGTLRYDPKSHESNYHKLSDPVPFFVGTGKPQQPLLLFTATGWDFKPGRYEGTLTLERESESAPLTKSFCLTIEKEDISRIKSSSYWSFRNDLPTKKPDSSAEFKDCYVLSQY